MSVFIKYKDITNKATAILSYFRKKNIIYSEEMLSHDGYDEFGPESNLWNLYIVVEINNDYIFYHYHWEDWFSNNQHEYILFQPKIKLSQTTNRNIDYFKIETQDSKFKKAFEERLQIIA